MKKVTFLLIFIISIFEIKAQYLLYPPQSQITTYADTNFSTRVPVYINSNMPRFEIAKFFIKSNTILAFIKYLVN